MSDPVVFLLCKCLLGNMHGWHHEAEMSQAVQRKLRYENRVI